MCENECTTMSCCEEEASNAAHEPVIDYIGPRIETLCKSRHMSKYRLSQLSGVPQISITRYINGCRIPALSTIEKLCKGFGISLARFFEDYEYQDDSSLTPEQKELLALMDRLDADGCKNLLTYAKFLAKQENADRF